MRSMTARRQESAARHLPPSRVRAAVARLSALLGAITATLAMAETSAGTPPEPLPVDVAFAASVSMETGKFIVKLDVMPGHYLYRDRFDVQANGNPVVPLALPKGKIKNDPTFGQVEVYEQPVAFSAATKLAGDAALTLTFQGCSAVAGVCYPPTRRTFALAPGKTDVRASELAPVSLKNQFRKQVSQ